MGVGGSSPLNPTKQTLTECFFVTLFVDLNHLFDVSFETLNAIFPFPQVFSLSPFPLAREPTVTAWRGTTLGRDITYAISLIVPLRFVRQLRNNMAQSLVLYVKSDARYGRRLAAPSPFLKSHIPFISTLLISFRFGCGCPTQSVILSMQSGATCSQGLRSACIHVATPLKKAKPQVLCASIAVASSEVEVSSVAKRKSKICALRLDVSADST